MRHDISTMFWKEWREILVWGGGRGKLGVLLVMVVCGIVLPLQEGRTWVTNPLFILFLAFMPLFLVSTTIADAFAGERERHTLETLLASRLNDSAILLGKTIAGASYGLALTWLILLVGLMTINVAFSAGGLLFYSLPVITAIVVFSVLTSFLSAGAGVLISLRAATVRQAQQTLSIAMLLLMLIPVIGTRLLPLDNSMQVAQVLQSIRPLPTALIAGAVLLAVDILLLLVALARFRRARLILD
ncbi:MAG: ABC transporter permease [Anaerolineae bacterium]